jgi:DNA repair photolyase
MSLIYQPKGRAAEYAPWALNIYNGCSHGCEYCYVPGIRRMSREDFKNNVSVRKDLLEKLDKELKKIKDKRHILLSFTSDPYQPHANTGVTRMVIMMLKRYGHSVCILTKGGMRATNDLDLLDENDEFAITLTFDNDEDSLRVEPGAELPQERMESLKYAHYKHIKTWISFEPVIRPNQTLNLMKQMLPYADMYKVGTINHSRLKAEINWEDFAEKAKDITEGKIDVYVKDDLRPFWKWR